MSIIDPSDLVLRAWLYQPECVYHHKEEDLEAARHLTGIAEITAERHNPAGSKWDYAKATVRFEPSELFLAQREARSKIDFIYDNELVLGILDPLIHEETTTPLLRLKIIVKEIGENLESCPMSFRIIGRMIGKELLKREKELSAEHDSRFEIRDVVKTLDDLLARRSRSD